MIKKVKRAISPNYFICIFARSASCNTCEKLIPIDKARSFNQHGIVNVFLTAFVSLYWFISQVTSVTKLYSSWLIEYNSEGGTIGKLSSNNVNK